jgi:GT2 family glycosyltransferase
VVVVDNNSNDHTRSVVEKFVKLGEFDTKYVFEGRQGVSFARNTGVQEAKGEIIAFTDDDCIVDPLWLESIAREFSIDPGISVLGGRVELYNPADKPITIRTSQERTVMSEASFDQLFALLPGCNLAFTRAAFDQIGGFDSEFGPGAKFRNGEDSDFLYRAFKKGFKMTYSPNALVYHNHGRRTDSHVHSLNRLYAFSRGAFYCKFILQGDRDILKMAYWEMCWLLKDLVRVLVSRRESTNQRILIWGIMGGAIRYLLSGGRKNDATSSR